MKFLNNKLLILLVSTVMFLSGCGSTKAIDAETLAKNIVEKVDFKDEITLITSDISKTLYDLDETNIKSIYTYIGSGATAEEVTVVEFNTLTDNDKSSFESRIEKQIENYETYIPKEIERIKKNVIIYNGNIAILCISDDSQAETKIKELLK